MRLERNTVPSFLETEMVYIKSETLKEQKNFWTTKPFGIVSIANNILITIYYIF
jgi:hypothetical protein